MTTKETTISIERMTTDEAENTARLMHEVITTLELYNEKARRAELEKYTPDTLQRLISDNPDFVLVAKVGQKIVGFCISNDDAETIWLAWYGIATDWRGHGIGKKLLLRLIEVMREQGVSKIWCDSRASNNISISLLQEVGFRQLCLLTNHWYGQDYVLLELILH